MKSASVFVICAVIISVLSGGMANAGESTASSKDVSEYEQYRGSRVIPTYANEFSVVSEYLTLLRTNFLLPDFKAQVKKRIRHVNLVLLKSELFRDPPNYALGYTFDVGWGWNDKALDSLRKCIDCSFKNNNLGTLLSTIDRLLAYLKRAHQLAPAQAAAFNVDFRDEFNQAVIQEINKKLNLIKYMEDHDLFTSSANADLDAFIVAYEGQRNGPMHDMNPRPEDVARVVRSEINRIETPNSAVTGCSGYLKNL